MKPLYILLFIALPSAIFAQSNYHEGYVLKNNGDTLKGYIDYREWNVSPISVDFKRNKKDRQSQEFNPENSKGFGIDGMGAYIRYSGLISRDQNHFPDLPGNLDTIRTKASIFLKQINTGTHLSLYTQTDEKKTRYFVAEAGAAPLELKYYQYYDDQHDVIERAFFRGQLIFYINKYIPANSSLISKAEKTPFEDEPLGDIINKINGGNIKGLAKRSAIRFFIGAGSVYNKTRFWEPRFTVATNSGSYYYNITSYSVYVSPQINLGIDLFVNPDVQKLIFRTTLSLSKLSAQLSYPITITKNGVLKFDQYIGSITPQLLYNIYNKDGFKIFIDGGASANFLKYSNTSFIDPTTGKIDPKQQLNGFNSFLVNFPLQTGVVINKRIEASFTYTPYAKFTTYSAITISNQSFCLGLKLFLGRN